ncbi:hypothetical protein NDU88_003400 [Pleurodeles waltl]|uniref:Uncharacterized protein n=1 Tax=Pleurodeles waltl TaxID=8319 RepID=A0AAV7MRP8_PLEWA|nr:hypothetical protein NDU88_003400 [Pleurodeles waltl]
MTRKRRVLRGSVSARWVRKPAGFKNQSKAQEGEDCFPQEAKECCRRKEGRTNRLQTGRRKKRTRRGGTSQRQCGDSGGRLGGEQERTDRPRSGKDVAQSGTATDTKRESGRREFIFIVHRRGSG